MRNTTKLKEILKNFTVDLAMNDGSNIILTIFDKEDQNTETFENKSYSVLIAKAFAYANKKKKYLAKSGAKDEQTR